jgi:hypothetical protein
VRGGALGAVAAFAAPLAGAAGLLLAYNVVRMGKAFTSPYGVVAPEWFTNPITVGLHGLLLSRTQGIWRFAPLSVLWPFALWRMARAGRGHAALFGSLVAVPVLFYATLLGWHGGPAWGPRYLCPVLPFLVVPVVLHVRSRAVLTLAVAAGAVANLPPVLGGPWGYPIPSRTASYVPSFWFLTQTAVPLAARLTVAAVLLVGCVLAAAWAWRERIAPPAHSA